MSLAAQDYPKVEVPLGFSFVNVHPDITPITSFNIFGGGGGFVYNFTPIIGVKAEFMGYTQGNGLKTRLTNAGYVVNGDVQGNLFTYMFGPQFKKHTGRFQPFGEALFGAAHTNTYANLFNTIHAVSGSSNNNAFAMAFGGGVDFVLGRNVQLRPVEVDYLYTRFGVSGTSYTGNQNNFRYVGGLNFTFGGAPPVPPTASCSAIAGRVLAGEPVTVTATGRQLSIPKHTMTYEWSCTGGKLSSTEYAHGHRRHDRHVAAAPTRPPPRSPTRKGTKNNVAIAVQLQRQRAAQLRHRCNCRRAQPRCKSGEPPPSQSVRPARIRPKSPYSWSATGGQLSGSGTTATLTATSADAGQTDHRHRNRHRFDMA